MKMFRKVLSGHALFLGMILSSPAIWAQSLTITTNGLLPQGIVGSAYSTTLAASGGATPYHWTLAAGALPAGVGLAATGVISGVPTTPGSYSFIARVTDSTAPTALSTIQPFAITIAPAATALSITTTATLPDGTLGTAYSQVLSATGGTPPYVWSLTSGTNTLPPGLSLSSAGVLSGKPTAPGANSFSIQVADSTMATFARNFSLTVDTPGPARSGVVSQVASGGGWKTSLYLANTSTAAVPVVVKFWSNNGTALSLPLSVTQVGGTQSSTAPIVNATVAPNATLLIESDSKATVESTGWAEVISTGPITGYSVFHYTSTSGVESEGTVPLETDFTPSFILPYDGTGGLATGVALTNLVAAQGAVVSATVWDGNGKQLATQNFALAAGGHIAFILADKIPSTISNRGIIEFRAAVNITGLGLRVNPTGGFTSIPKLQRP